MEKYTVISGDMNVQVEGETHHMAVMKAIEKEKPKSLGLIVSCLKEGDGEYDEMYFLTTRLLENMGYNIETENPADYENPPI